MPLLCRTAPREDRTQPDVWLQVMTSADQVTALGSLPVSSVLAKNLVLKDKKKKIFLVVIEHDRELDLKVLPKQLVQWYCTATCCLGLHWCLQPGATGPLRFVRGDEVEHLLAVPPGSVTPLAVINDQSNTAVVIVSAGIVKAQSVLVHPLINTATVQMPSADLLVCVCRPDISHMLVTVVPGIHQAIWKSAPRCRLGRYSDSC